MDAINKKKEGVVINLSQKTNYRFSRDFRRILDTFFVYVPIIVGVIWLIQATYSIFTTNPYGTVKLIGFPENIHTLTVIPTVLLYFFSFYSLNYIDSIARVVASVGITLLGIVFNGFVWSFFNQMFYGEEGIALLNLAMFFALVVMLFIINLRIDHPYRKVIKINWYMLPLSIAYAISIYFFVNSGFYDIYHLQKGVNPHGIEWFFEQLMGLLVWVGILRRRI